MDKSLEAELFKAMSLKENNFSDIEDRLSDSTKNIIEKTKTSKALRDSYGNSLLAIGNDSKTEQPFTDYSFSNDTLNWPLWLALYNDSWVFKKAIDKPAQDEIKCGITIEGDFDKKNIYKRLKTYRDDLIQCLKWGGLFGGSVMVMMFDNFKPEDYKNPMIMNLNKVKTSKVMKFYVVDRWYGVSPDYNKVVTKMTDLDYGKPKYYDITMANGKTFKYHHDYVIRYENRDAPKLVKNGMLQGWGYSEGSHIIGELIRDEKLKTSIQSLMNKALIEVIKMSGMRGIFMGADKTNEEQMRKRLEMVNWGRSFNSLTFLDKDDDYQMNSFSGLSGLSDLLEQNMWLISSALDMPGILFGELKGGLSQESEAMERYDDVIQGRCESYVRPIYEKLLKVLYIMEGINEKPEFTFNSLLMKKQDKERIEGIQNFVQLCSQLLGDGVITTKQYAKALQTYSNNGTVDFGLTDEVINKLDESFANELEGLEFETIGGNDDNNDR